MFAGGEETPWTRAPAWCAPSGPPRPLLGFAVRLAGDTGRAFSCDYGGVFSSGLTVDGVGSGEVCVSPMPNDPLVAIRFGLGAGA